MAIAKKKKRFFEVKIPLINKETQLFGMDNSELEGKHIKYDLTRILKGKSVLLDLKVHKDGEELTTKPAGLNIVSYYIRRAMRKGVDYVEDSFDLECNDAVLKVKPILIARRKISKAVRRALRQKAKEEIENLLSEKNYEEIFEEILKNRIQKELSLKMRKIYPLSMFEIRSLKVEKILDAPKTVKKKISKEDKKSEETSEEKTESKEEEIPKKKITKESSKEKKE